MLVGLGKHNKNKLVCIFQSTVSLVSWKTSPTVMSTVQNAQATSANPDAWMRHLNIIMP